MEGVTDPLNQALLDDWQRDFPILSTPFDEIGATMELSGEDVIDRLKNQRRNGRVTRVGATLAPNTISASTLAAVSAPEDRIEEVAAIIGREAGVNHSYLRENDWNLWFVVTGPDRADVDATLERIGNASGLRVLDLRLVRPFNVDLGFALRKKGALLHGAPKQADPSVLMDGDRAILQTLLRGLPLAKHPYDEIARTLGRTEDDILNRVRVLTDAAIISRLGVIVRHRALGWRSNAMVVWDLPHEQIDVAGPVLAAQPGVTLCYERTPVEGIWPYRLYSMIHARSRAEALEVLGRVSALPELAGVPYLPLFSLHCFKQTGAMVQRPVEAAA